MTFKSTSVLLILACQQLCCVMAAECTTAIIASVFGTIGALLVIALVVALVWYCCRHRNSASFSSTSSADTASDPEFSFPGKTKGGEIGLNGSGTPVTFSHHYSEKAPTVAYNTSGVVNPAFGRSRDVLIDMPPGNKGEVKIDVDGDPSVKPPSYNRDVKIDMDGKSDIKTPSGSGDFRLDMDWDPRLDVTAPEKENRSKLNPPSVSGTALDLPDVDKPSGGSLPGADANVVIKGPSTPKLDVSGMGDLEVVDASLERPGHGGFGLLIARDKTLLPPALFVREVTPGGIAAKTGLIEKGDKIIEINGVSIEGMAHDKAMELLRDDERPQLHLKLLKRALYKEKDRSFDLPGGSIGQSYNADNAEPVLQANTPSLDVEGLQGKAPDVGSMDIYVKKPRADISEPGVDMTEGKLQTQLSGPDAFTDVDLSGPSTGWDIPSVKKKRGNCFSCASTGDKEEPYRKGRANVGLDLDRPDMKTGGRFSGPSVNGERFELDSGAPDAFISSGTNTKLDLNAPDIQTPEGKVRTQISGPDIGFSSSKQHSPQARLHTPPDELDLPSKEKKGGSCISCAGGTNKDEPYIKRKGTTDLEFDGPGDSVEMKTGGKFDLSGYSSGVKGAEREIKTEEFGLRASAPGVDLDADKEGNIGFSGPNSSLASPGTAAKVRRSSFDGEVNTRQPNMGSKVNKPKVGLQANAPDITVQETNSAVSTGKIKNPSVNPRGSSAEIDMYSSKKKRGNCLTCAGTGDKDEPYRKAKGNARYAFDNPEVAGSMEMGKITGPSVDTSRPNVDLSGRLPKGEMSSNVSDDSATDRPSLDVGVSTGKTPGVKAQIDTPSAGLQFPKNDLSFSAEPSGPDVDIPIRSPKAGISTNVPEIDAPEANISTNMTSRDIDASTGELRGPKVEVNEPSAELGLPSVKKKGGSCFSCVGKGKKDEPYRTAKREASFGFDGPEVDASLPSGSINAGMSGPDFDVSEPKAAISKPDFGTGGPRLGGSMPEVDANSPKVDIDVMKGASEPEFEVRRPNAGISVPGRDLSEPKTSVSGPDFDVSGPKAAISKPDFGAGGPRLGGSIPDVDAKEPKVDIDVMKGASGPTFEVRRPNAGISVPGRDLSEPGTGVSGLDFDLHAPKSRISGPDIDARGSKVGFYGPGLDVSGTSKDVSGPDFDLRGPKAGISGPEFDVLRPKADISGPNFDARGPKADTSGPDVDISGPKPGVTRPDFNVHGPKVDVSTGKRKVELGTNTDGLDVPEGKIRGKRPGSDVKVPTGPPSAELGFPSKKAKGASCLSCAGSTDNDEPYRKSKGSTKFAFKGPDVDVKGPATNIERREGSDENELHLNASPLHVDTPNLDGEIGFPRSTTSFPSTSGGRDLYVGGRGPDQDMRKGAPNIEVDANTPNLNQPRGELQTEMLSQEYSTGDVQGPSADGRLPSRKKVRGNCLSCAGDADKDEPYGKSPRITELDRPDINGSVEIKKGGKLHFGEPNANIDGPHFEATTPQIEQPSSKTNVGFKTPKFDITKAAQNGEIDLTAPQFSHGKPKIPGPSIGVANKDFGIREPDPDPNTPLGEGDLGINKPDISVPKGKFDLDDNSPDLEVSPTKPGFGVKGLNFDTPEKDGEADDLRLGGSMPDLDLSGKRKEIGLGISDIEENKKGDKRDIDANSLDLEVSGTKLPFGERELDIDNPEPDIPIPTGDLRFGTSTPALDVSKKKPEIDLGMKGLDRKMTDDDFNVLVTKPPSVERNGKAAIQSNGKAFDIDVDWGVKTSTPKAPKARSELHIETEPLDGDIPVANDYNFQLESTPETFPSVDYEEPRSLQRYDEIRPDMELRLVSPTKADGPDHAFNFGSSSLEMEQNDKQLKPGRMSLVKVEENVTVCSASLEEEEPLSPRNRTLTLDREIKQTIEVVFPGEDSSGEKRRSSNTSSLSSSDNDADNEKKLKRKKKLRLLKGFRKTSTSSASSKEGGGQKKKERRSSESSSSSENENERRKESKDPLRDEALKRINQDDLPKENEAKCSTASASSSDVGEHRNGEESKDKIAPEVNITSSIIGLEPDISLNAVTPDSPSLRRNSKKAKGRESSTSSSSDEDTGKKSFDKETSKRKKKSALLKDFRKSSTSSASSREGRPATRQKKSERETSTSSSSSEDEGEGKGGRKKGTEQPKAKTGSYLHLSDQSPTVIKQEEFPDRKESKRSLSSSSSSSSDNEGHKSKKETKDIPTTEETTVISKICSGPDVSLDLATPDITSLPIESQKVKERKSPTSSPSSDENVGRKKVEYTIVPTEYHVSVEKKETEKSWPTMPSVKATGRDASLNPEKQRNKAESIEQKSSTSSSDGEASNIPQESKSSILYQVEYFTNQQKYIIAPQDDQDRPVLSVGDVQKDASVVEFHPVKFKSPDQSPKRPSERKSSTTSSSSSDEEVAHKEKEKARQRKSSSSSDDSGRIPSKADITTYSYEYETTHHVLTPDYPTADKAKFSAVHEHPVVIVTRSFKRPLLENIGPTDGDQYEPQETGLQLDEHPTEVTHDLEYPHNTGTVEKDTDKHVQEEDILPVFKLKPDFSVELEQDDKASKDEYKHENDHSIPAEIEHRASPTWHMQPHAFETIYHENIPENPAKNEDSFEVQERSPIVVSRSIKRIALEGLDLEDEPLLHNATKDIQLSEPSNDFQLEYPEGDNVFATGENDLNIADEEWILSHSLKKDELDIEALQATLDLPKLKDQSRSDSSLIEDDKQTTPHENSPRDTTRRGSNSRLWELMQGYLIERPVMDDDETEANNEKAEKAKKEEEFRVETTKLETKVERTVYHMSLQPAKFETVNVPLQFVDKQPGKEVITSVPRVERTASKDKSIPMQFDPVKIQVDLGGKRVDTGWRKQPSLPPDEDDNNEDDAWMRHYSKGLQTGQHQPGSARSLERESTSTQSGGLSFSKVPHVKGVRTSAEKEKPRYAIETRIRTEPLALRSSTDQSQARKSREETERPSVSSLRTLWDK